MSFQSGGFTEDDQAKIAEEVLGRVQAKRSGLGFSGSADNVAASTNNSSSASSSWFHQAESVGEQPASGKDNQDTTEGAFPWDGGQRGKAGGAVRKQGGTAISSLHKEQQVNEGVFALAKHLSQGTNWHLTILMHRPEGRNKRVPYRGTESATSCLLKRPARRETVRTATLGMRLANYYRRALQHDCTGIS